MVTVRARVSGTGESLADLADQGAIALAQQCAPLDERVVEVALASRVTLPLMVLWPLSAVERAPGRDDGDV